LERSKRLSKDKQEMQREFGFLREQRPKAFIRLRGKTAQIYWE
jgi:hypothetical protein